MAEADPQKTFNVHEAKTHLSRLIERAHAGEEIVLAEAGVPYAKLVPVQPVILPPRQPGRFKHLLRNVSYDDVMAPCLTEAQALIEDLTVVTRDPEIAAFGCKVLW